LRILRMVWGAILLVPNTSKGLCLIAKVALR
jgi:hypothetical protein